MKADALLDSNVLIAVVAEAHEHHAASLELLVGGTSAQFAVAAHSFAEAYSTLTRHGAHGLFRFTPEEAWAALASVRAVTWLVGLTAAQTFDATRAFAQGGGVGARLYDRLIGETAVVHEIPVIVTWNLAHMRSLFRDRSVVTPSGFGAAV